MIRKLTAFFMALCFIFTMSINAFAEDFDPGRLGSITLTLFGQDGKTPVSGAELSVYYVATVELNKKGDLSYVFTKEFENCDAALNDPALSVVLEKFVEENAVPVKKAVTDSKGKVTVGNLPLGLYFVKQTDSQKFGFSCMSFLVTVPSKNNGKYIYDVNASPKTETVKLVDITVKKNWNVDETTKVPESVTVELLRDGVKVESVVLSEKNSWKATFYNMPASDSYSIKEVDVPKGFTASYSNRGYEFTVTNSASLIQTGQLIWPVPVLAMAGLILISTGTVVLKKQRNKNG